MFTSLLHTPTHTHCPPTHPCISLHPFPSGMEVATYNGDVGGITSTPYACLRPPPYQHTLTPNPTHPTTLLHPSHRAKKLLLTMVMVVALHQHPMHAYLPSPHLHTHTHSSPLHIPLTYYTPSTYNGDGGGITSAPCACLYPVWANVINDDEVFWDIVYGYCLPLRKLWKTKIDTILLENVSIKSAKVLLLVFFFFQSHAQLLE